MVIVKVNKMAEGPDPTNRSSQDKSSHQEEQEPVVVEPDVTCGHCKRELNNPYLLCCLHSVCGECLPNMVVENGQLKCPKCGDTSTHYNDRKVLESECRVDSLRCVPVPNGPLARYIEGMKIVQKVTQNVPIPCGSKRCKSGDSPSTVFCTDCSKFLCERCYGAHEMIDEYEDHTVKTLEEICSSTSLTGPLLVKKTDIPTCPHHGGEPLKYMCDKCTTLLCQACTVDKDPGKLSHTPRYLKKVVMETHIQSTRIARCTVKSTREVCTTAKERARVKMTEVDESTDRALREVDHAFEEISRVLQQRKEELHQQIRAVNNEKKAAIDRTMRTLDEEDQTLGHCQAVLDLLVAHGNNHEIIVSNSIVSNKQEAIISNRHKNVGSVPVSTEVGFLPSRKNDLIKAIGEFGVVEDGACPVNCTVEPKPETVHWNGSDPLKLTVSTFDSKNIQCKQGGDNVEAFLRPKSPIPGPAIKARVVDDENGQYTLSFPITYQGECDLSILVNGSDVRGSPFGVDLLPKPKPVKLNKIVAEIGANKGCLNFPKQPGGPLGIVVAQNGHTFIADQPSHQIHVFDEQRKHIRSFGQPGSGNGQLQQPEGVAVDAEGLVYVADYSNNRIEVFREDGTFVRHFGTGQLRGPWRVAVNNKRVYVVEYLNYRIVIFTLEGQLIDTIGSEGSGPGQFNNPSAVAFSPDGDMYVADGYNHRIQVFDSDGVYQREFGGGRLKYPRDILITADGHVLVADYANNRVVIFNTTGQLIHSFLVPSQPYGLAIDHNGDLLVTLCRDRQVAVF